MNLLTSCQEGKVKVQEALRFYGWTDRVKSWQSSADQLPPSQNQSCRKTYCRSRQGQWDLLPKWEGPLNEGYKPHRKRTRAAYPRMDTAQASPHSAMIIYST